jgi:hypothetical protein
MSTIAFGKKPVQNTMQAGLALERHYSVAEVATMWALSENTVRRMFEEEDGVLHWGTLQRAASAAIEPSAFRRAFSIAFTESANCGWGEQRASTKMRTLFTGLKGVED